MFCPKCGTENPETGRFCRSCGTDLGNISAVLSGELNPSTPATYIDHKGKIRSNDPLDVLSNAVRSLMMGVGFLVVSFALFFTGVAGGRAWWWAMLFPAFASIATGISQYVKYKSLEAKKGTVIQQPSFQVSQPPQSLPPNQTEFIKPLPATFATGDLIAPPSVTEHTTKHLEIKNDGDTVNSPKK